MARLRLASISAGLASLVPSLSLALEAHADAHVGLNQAAAEAEHGLLRLRSSPAAQADQVDEPAEQVSQNAIKAQRLFVMFATSHLFLLTKSYN